MGWTELTVVVVALTDIVELTVPEKCKKETWENKETKLESTNSILTCREGHCCCQGNRPCSYWLASVKWCWQTGISWENKCTTEKNFKIIAFRWKLTSLQLSLHQQDPALRNITFKVIVVFLLLPPMASHFVQVSNIHRSKWWDLPVEP